MDTTQTTTRSTRRFTRLLSGAILAGAMLLALASPADAGFRGPEIAGVLQGTSTLRMQQGLSCGTDGSVSVALNHDPRTKSGQAGWSYSRYYAGDGRNPWVISNWTAVWANSGYQQHWELANNAWRRPMAGSISVDVPPHYRNTNVWELRYEIVGGRWSHEWVFLGTCTPPPGA